MSTQQRYSKRDFGRTSQTDPGSDMLSEQWRIAGLLNSRGQVEGEWVPREAIFLRHDIMPRGDYLNYRRVDEYAQIQRQLPPIRVQRDTFVLIDGHHRLSACYDKNYSELCIRIVEEDMPDDELREAAFHANVDHGEALRPRDRAEHLKYLIGKHGLVWTDIQYAAACGVNRHTVADYREKLGKQRPRAAFDAAHGKAGNGAFRPDNEREKSSTDSKVRKLPNGARDLRQEPLPAAGRWPDDDLPVRQAYDESADEGDGVSPQRPPAPDPAREDLDALIAWFKAMPNVGDAAAMVAELRDAGETRTFGFLVAGGFRLCQDLVSALANLEALT